MNAERPDAAPVTVVGAGNWWIGSDRVGPRVLQKIRGRYGPEVEVHDMGSAALALLDHLHGQELMCVIDACVLGGAPGEIRVLEPDPNREPTPVGSLHQVGPLETLAIAARVVPEAMPKRALLIAIETEGIDAIAEESACQEAIAVLDAEIERWRKSRQAASGAACAASDGTKPEPACT